MDIITSIKIFNSQFLVLINFKDLLS